MSIDSLSNGLRRSPIPRVAALTVLVLASSCLACHRPSGHGHYDGDLDKVREIDAAARNGDVKWAKALLEGESDLVFSKERDTGNTPLCVAAKYGHKEVAELLLAKVAEVNASCEFDGSPLHLAAANGNKDVVELLLAEGADVNAKASYGWTALHLAAFWSLAPAGQSKENSAVAAPRDYKDVAALLLAHKADVNAKESNYGYTPLHLAAVAHNKDVAELLLAKGADVNVREMYGFTPLHVAAMGGEKDIVELLLANGADVNARSNSGALPSYPLAHGGDMNVAELVRASQTDAKGKLNKGFTPLHAAAFFHRSDVVALLRQRDGHE